MKKAFDTVLIANRGEIALRIIRACRELGLKSALAASPSDMGSLPAREADRVVPLKETMGYLDVSQLMAAAKAAGAGALHPGYGFLSERAALAEACAAAGLTWIGPPPAVLKVLGEKRSARALAEKTGVPILPWARPEDPNAVGRMKYPLLVKAAAGGGGRGQRVVKKAAELPEALEAASREAGASFGDPAVFLERYLEAPRHVEFQILADGRGQTVHLLERECSVQRRHQKLVEECPSPALSAGLRSRMGEVAVRLAKAAGYRGLGTVEFLLEGQAFYFLEVNARLQVEHPVTEAVTGLDLVQWQLRMSLGEPFPHNQDEIHGRGHAVEARLCAEDPDRDFLPSGGEVALLRLETPPGLRWDTALEAGAKVGTEYDSLLAKCIAWGEDRAGAIRRLDGALRQSALLGLRHNAAYLRFILNHPRFLKGDYATDFVRNTEKEWAGRKRALPPEALAAAAAMREGSTMGTARPSDPWNTVQGWLP